MRLLPVLGLCCVASVVGCGVGVQSSPSAHVAFTGKVHGGNQPVVGATIQLYAAGASGYGSAATPLLVLPVVTLADGSFSITADYVCPTATTQVYLTATGGNPGLAPGTNNAALAEMVALGNCGALTPSTFVQVNELTTVAAVFSLAPFMTDLTHVGTSATNAVGLQSAMASPEVMVPKATGVAAVGLSGSALLTFGGPERPTAKINTLGDVLAACVNSNGSAAAGSACGLLFAATTPAGGTVPTDTVQAALSMAQHLTTGVSAQFALGAANAPFQPTLSTAPADWALGYGDSISGQYALGSAVDGLGDFWTGGYYYSPGFLAGIGPYGTAVSNATAITAVAIDQNENLWIPSLQGYVSPYYSGGMYEFSSSGSKAPCGSSCGPFTNIPFIAVAVDKNNHVWGVDESGDLFEMLTNGTLVSPPGGYAGVKVDSTTIYNGDSPRARPQIAFDNANNLWIVNPTSNTLVKVTKSGMTVSAQTFTSGNLETPTSVAIDHTGAVWVASVASGTVLTKFNSDGSVAVPSFASKGGGEGSLAVDGSGNIWVSGYSVYSPAGVLLASSLGDGFPYLGRNYVATDAAGAVWTVGSVYHIALYTKLVGVAVPTGASLSEALAAGTLGARP